MTLPINYSSGSTVAASDINAITAAANTSTKALNSFAPTDFGFISWNFDGSLFGFAGGSTTFTAGQAYLMLLPIRQSCTISNVWVNVSSAGSSMTTGQNFAGLFNSGGTLLSATADQSTTWQSGGMKSMALVTPQAVSPGYYYVGWYVNGSVLPKFYIGYTTQAGVAFNSAAGTPYRSILDTGRTLTTGFVSPVTLTGLNTTWWVAVS